MVRARTSNLWCGITILLIICCCSLAWANGKYGGGSGTPEDPYQIWDANDMQAIGAEPNDWDKCFKLMADIDLGGYSGTQFNLIGRYTGSTDPDPLPFTGVFDGNNHTIANFTYDSRDPDYIGLFVCVNDPNAEIKNLRMTNADVDAASPSASWKGSYVGSLVGMLRAGTITNCYISGSVRGGPKSVGGLAGVNHSTIRNCQVEMAGVAGHNFVGGMVGTSTGQIIDCRASCDLTATWEAGGLVGSNKGTILDSHATTRIDGGVNVGGLAGQNEGQIANCYSMAAITGDSSSAGGLVGANEGSIENCYSTADVQGSSYIGGLAGGSSGLIIACYATGDVNGVSRVGGLVGIQANHSVTRQCFSTGNVMASGDEVGRLVGVNVGSMSDCYATGSVEGRDSVGGLAGVNARVITGCYATGSVTGRFFVGGLAGRNQDRSAVIADSYWNIETGEPNACGLDFGGAVGCDPNYGKTTAEMYQQSTYESWDFINVWGIGENQTYPYLRTVPAGDINKDRIVNFLDLCIVADQWMKEP